MPPCRNTTAAAPQGAQPWQNQFAALDNDPIDPAFPNRRNTPDLHYVVHDALSPGLVRVSTPLTGKNFVSWSKSMLIALGAKLKLGFIDGSITHPPRNSPEYSVEKG
ncbi:hypothetical protein ACS0TY_011240 [Phlomoides rotata]